MAYPPLYNSGAGPILSGAQNLAVQKPFLVKALFHGLSEKGFCTARYLRHCRKYGSVGSDYMKEDGLLEVFSSGGGGSELLLQCWTSLMIP